MDKRYWSGLLIALALLIVAVPAQAEEGLPATLASDREQLTVGDPVELTLEVNHPAGYQVIIPQLEGTWGDLEVRSQSPERARTAARLIAPGAVLDYGPLAFQPDSWRKLKIEPTMISWKGDEIVFLTMEEELDPSALEIITAPLPAS